jgi:hypothetical protein
MYVVRTARCFVIPCECSEHPATCQYFIGIIDILRHAWRETLRHLTSFHHMTKDCKRLQKITTDYHGFTGVYSTVQVQVLNRYPVPGTRYPFTRYPVLDPLWVCPQLLYVYKEILFQRDTVQRDTVQRDTVPVPQNWLLARCCRIDRCSQTLSSVNSTNTNSTSNIIES